MEIMEKASKYKYNSILINAFRPSEGRIITKGKESLKYHYTSPEAFLNILKHRSVYFTDIRYLNDKKEDIYLIELIERFVSKNKERFPNVANSFDYMIGKSTDKPTTSLSEKSYNYEKDRKFVFCSCVEPDLLCMWNYYVNNGDYQGYNIGFNIEKFLKTFDTDEPKSADPFIVLYGQVLYEEKRQFAEIKREIETIESDYTLEGIEYAKVRLLMYIDRYSPFFKHSKFAHEKEYRVVIEIREKYLKEDGFKNFFGKNNQKITYEFRTKNGIVVPFLKVKYNDNSVSRIYVSPKTEYDIAKESIQELLRVNRYENVSIHKSAVPIRF